MARLTSRTAALGLMLTMLGTTASAVEATWTAASGLLPDQAGLGWALTDNASPEAPVLSNDVLTLQTSTNSELLHYSLDGAALDMDTATPYWIEARVKYVSGGQTAGWWRAPIFLGIRAANGVLATLEIRSDLIFTRQGDNSLGQQAVVDTNGDFHTYRLELAGTAPGSMVNVYQDGLLVLSDNAAYDTTGSARVFWGDASTLAFGRSDWTYVSTNLAAVPEPTPAALFAAGLGVLAMRARRRRLDD